MLNNIDYAYMEKILIDKNNHDYYNIPYRFIFADEEYETSINFAYLNAKLNDIYVRYKLDFDESWMWTKRMNYSQYLTEMNKLVKRLYTMNIDKLLAEYIVTDVLTLLNSMVDMFDSGSKINIDISIVGLAQDVLAKPEVYDVIMKEHANASMTPEEINHKKEELLHSLKTLDIYGVHDLLQSEEGVKSDQVFNCLIGLWMRTRIQNMYEVAPRFLPERWIDGIVNRDSHFIETNNNRQAAMVSKQTIRDAGNENRKVGILAQDIYINGEDCGSVNYYDVKIGSEKELANFTFKYQVLPDGSLHEITMDDTNLVGVPIKIRSSLTCANNDGICATCFGAHARWNLDTATYRKQVGFEFARQDISPASQEVLSFKHSVTPDFIPINFIITNTSTKEVTHDHSFLFHREFNNIILEDGVQCLMYPKDIILSPYKDNKTDKFHYIDNEYLEYDIIRVRVLHFIKGQVLYTVRMETTKTKTSKIIKPVPFKLGGFPFLDMKALDKNTAIDVTKDHKLQYVIPNRSKTDKFSQLKKLFKSESTPENQTASKDPLNEDQKYYDTMEDMMERARAIVPGVHICSLEVLLRNKIKSKTNINFRPDWRVPDAKKDIQILSIDRALNHLRSLTVKLGLGYFGNRIQDEFYYNPDNMEPSSYDILFDTLEQLIAENSYRHGDEIDEDDIAYDYHLGDEIV